MKENSVLDKKCFGHNAIINNRDNFFKIYDKECLNYCWLFISEDFDKYLSFRGKCEYEIFFGNITINGVNFSAPSKGNIYSPISHPLVTFEINQCSKESYQTLDECVEFLNKIDISDNEKSLLNSLLTIKNQVADDKKWLAIRLSTINSHVCNDIEQLKEFKRIFEVSTDFPFSKKLKFSVSKDENPSYIMSEEIKDCIHNILNFKTEEPKKDLSVVLVGPKDAGKSSLMRTLINSIFSRDCKEIYIIDADPGQSEFSPSGCISLVRITGPLFGPPFINQYSQKVKIIKQCFLGDTSPNNDPKLYCRSFENVYHSFLESEFVTRPPMIVNTMGWTQGLGLSLLAFKLLITNPMYVIQLKKGRSEKELIDINKASLDEVSKNDSLLQNVQKNFDSTVFILKSVVNIGHRHELPLKPIQYRDLMMISYLFHHVANVPLCFPKGLLPEHFSQNPISRLRCHIPMYLKYIQNKDSRITEENSLPIVSLKTIYTKNNREYEQTVTGDYFAMQWVAICRPCNRLKYRSVIMNNKYTKRKETRPMLCLGMGLVSHVRPWCREIDLLTGADVNTLEGSYLVKGNVFPPDCLLLNQSEVQTKASLTCVPFVSPMITAGAGRTSIGTRKSLPKIRRHQH